MNPFTRTSVPRQALGWKAAMAGCATLASILLLPGCDRSSSPTSPFSLAASDAQGVVSDVFGLPLAGVRVEATSGPAAGQFVMTGEDGRFLLGGAARGNYVSLRMTRVGFDTELILYYPGTDPQVKLWPVFEPRPDEGAYTFSVTADSGCTALPAELRTRTYTGAIGRTGNPLASPQWFTIGLGGAEFYPTQRVMYGSTTAGDVALFVGSWEAVLTWLEDDPIVERVGSESYLSVLGRARGTGVFDSTSVTTDLDGTISYCARDAGNQVFFQCAVPEVSCTSTRHRLTVSLR